MLSNNEKIGIFNFFLHSPSLCSKLEKHEKYFFNQLFFLLESPIQDFSMYQ